MDPSLDMLVQLADSHSPQLLILVGPNGAGKSSFYHRYLTALDLPFINAYLIGSALVKAGAPAKEETERLAAHLAEQRRRELVANRVSFITETVFSDHAGAKVHSLRDSAAQSIFPSEQRLTGRNSIF